MRTLFALALLAIIHFSLYPWRFDPRLAHPLMWIPIRGDNDWSDFVINIFFYLPPALVGQWAFGEKGKKLRTALLVAAGLTLLSLSVESLQLIIPRRYANLRDVFCNAAGALAGVGLGCVFRPPQGIAIAWERVPRRGLMLALMLIVFATWQAFPFVPNLHYTLLLLFPKALLQPSGLFPDLVEVFFAILAIYLVARSVSLPPLPVAAAAALLLPAQHFLRHLQLSSARVTGAGLALAAGVALFRRPGRVHYFLLAAVLTLWILLRQFSPGAAVSGWLPSNWAEVTGRESGLRLMAGKTLLCAAALWFWWQAAMPLATVEEPAGAASGGTPTSSNS